MSKKFDFKSMNVEQLQDFLLKLKKELFNLRFQKVHGELQNTARFRQVRRDIARVNTFIVEKKGDLTNA